jgi:predicted DNA-binding protein with PD1-like motif
MPIPMRRIDHPGTPSEQRIHSAVCRGQSFEATLEPGHSLIESVTIAMARFGVSSAALRLSGGSFDCFAYCMPALSKTRDHAVYFSETFGVEGEVSLETASVTYGVRDGKPWLHCHAVWREPDGRRHCGHLLPDQVRVIKKIEATGSAVHGAEFVVSPDLETNFSLFVPTVTAATPDAQTSSNSQPSYIVRLSPNVDVCHALESFCYQKGITSATIQGGVGSTVGAVFDDGRVVEPFVTELLIRSGDIGIDAAGQPNARIDIAMVDYKGTVSEGLLARGQNPVLVTFELMIQPLGA